MNKVEIISLITILAIALIITIISFIRKSKEEKIKSIKEWLLYAVIEAEKALGSNTGSIKLRYVYNLAVTKFPFISTLITFEEFSKYVDEALEKMETLLKENIQIKEYIDK